MKEKPFWRKRLEARPLVVQDGQRADPSSQSGRGRAAATKSVIGSVSGLVRAGPLALAAKVRRHLKTPLFANAYHLMINTGLNSVLGFVFWPVAARLYAPDDVGLASATLSAIIFLSGFSSLGLGVGLIRFLPGAGPAGDRMLDSAFTLTAAVSLAFAAAFLAGLPIWSPALTVISSQPALLSGFALLVVLFAWGNVVNQTFVAHRAARFTLLRSTVMGVLKIGLLILLPAAFGAWGIVAATGIALAVSLGIAMLWFLPRVQRSYRPRIGLDSGILRNLVPYSLANYVASFLTQVAQMVTILPIMALNILGPEESAYTYVAWMIANALFMISGAVATSTFAEGSNEGHLLRDAVRKGLRLTLGLLTPAILLTFILGDDVLRVFGKEYAEQARDLLYILVLSAIPVGVTNIYFAMKRVSKETGTILVLSLIVAGNTLGWSRLLMPRYGIASTGIGWLMGHGIVCGLIAATMWKRTRFRRGDSARSLKQEIL